MEDKTVNQEKRPDCSIIKELIKQYPNDLELGIIIRQIFGIK
jgi:hypothetical protein